MSNYTNNQVVEGLLDIKSFRTQVAVQATSASTMSLTSSTEHTLIFTGAVDGQIIKLQDATTISAGFRQGIHNNSSFALVVQDGSGTVIARLDKGDRTMIVLQVAGTIAGTWSFEFIASGTNISFSAAQEGFEDFMYDAYAGAGSNDNQYSFTAIANSGLSTIDGSVPPASNDYEGMHSLSSSTSATSRPLVSAFASVNRIALGSLQEDYELRVRIGPIADVTQKYTTRYGLMDIDTIGLPTNGIYFSYDPVYPVTPVAQIVTATPVIGTTTTQTFIQNVNGTGYTYLYQVNKTVTVTPNAFPVATYQQISITWTRANNTLYTITINGTLVSYTSDANATDAEIAAGLESAINTNGAINTAVVAAGITKPITITSLVLGQAFTYSTSATLTPTLVTANVPVAIYTETIAGVPYTYTSDGTPTASEVVAGLTALINADGACPATASGTTTLLLTSKVIGTDYTFSGTANLTQLETTVMLTATGVVTALKALMAADPAVDVSGTTTLIMTAKVAGTAFTYAGTRLTEVLTLPNTPEVLHSGNWMASTTNGSTTTSINTGVPVVEAQWYILTAVTNATASIVDFYIDGIKVGTSITNIPTGISKAMRYIFKLEKTVGTTPRTTDIDYIGWRRLRI